MSNLNFTEENYLKSIWNEVQQTPSRRTTQATLARTHGHSRASAHKVIHKLTDAGFVRSEADGTLRLTPQGEAYGVTLVRQHRLWEVFLVDKLGYSWTEVHDIAERLEHIGDATLTERLEHFLNYPRFDPHGDPIPDRNGTIEKTVYLPLAECEIGRTYTVVGVKEQSTSFLDYMQRSGLTIGTHLAVESKMAFDGSLFIVIVTNQAERSLPLNLSPFAADHIIVE